MTAQVAADLRAAADVLRRDGWTQGAYLNSDTGCRCLVGALDYVYGRRGVGWMGDSSESEAYDALEAVIGDQSPIAWNDRRGRTADEVIAALEAAADAAEADQ